LRLCLTFARLSSTAELAHIRSLLFAPGSDEGKLLKAFESGADAVVADLEDAVAPREKERARVDDRPAGRRARPSGACGGERSD
jgi:HpcH/HpaI aldolase/citrate lyase family